MTNPIRPEEAAARKLADLPPGVIDVFNELIARHFNGTSATFRQDEVITALADHCVIEYEQEAFDRRLLDVEPVYREHGWDVTYDKPGYNESYEPTFTFSRAR